MNSVLFHLKFKERNKNEKKVILYNLSGKTKKEGRDSADFVISDTGIVFSL
jgi:hypothetical protein